MRRIAACLILLTFLLMFAGCNNDAPGGEVQLGREFDFSGVTQVKLVNGHNGSTSFITDENAIAEITSFVGDTIGKSLELNIRFKLSTNLSNNYNASLAFEDAVILLTK